MDKIVQLTDVVARVVKWYADADAWKAKLYFLEDTATQTYAVIDVPEPDHPENEPGFVVMAKVAGDKVLIQIDNTDRPLDEAFIKAGIDSQNIIFDTDNFSA